MFSLLGSGSSSASSTPSSSRRSSISLCSTSSNTPAHTHNGWKRFRNAIGGLKERQPTPRPPCEPTQLPLTGPSLEDIQIFDAVCVRRNEKSPWVRAITWRDPNWQKVHQYVVYFLCLNENKNLGLTVEDQHFVVPIPNGLSAGQTAKISNGASALVAQVDRAGSVAQFRLAVRDQRAYQGAYQITVDGEGAGVLIGASPAVLLDTPVVKNTSRATVVGVPRSCFFFGPTKSFRGVEPSAPYGTTPALPMDSTYKIPIAAFCEHYSSVWCTTVKFHLSEWRRIEKCRVSFEFTCDNRNIDPRAFSILVYPKQIADEVRNLTDGTKFSCNGTNFDVVMQPYGEVLHVSLVTSRPQCVGKYRISVASLGSSGMPFGSSPAISFRIPEPQTITVFKVFARLDDPHMGANRDFLEPSNRRLIKYYY